MAAPSMKLGLHVSIDGQKPREIGTVDVPVRLVLGAGSGNLLPLGSIQVDTETLNANIADALVQAADELRGMNSTPPTCTAHNPVQHRDGKPPWCNTCGLTANGTPRRG